MSEMKKDKRYPDGVSFTCLTCNKAYEVLRKEGKMDRSRFSKEERQTWKAGYRKCNLCRELLPFEKFGKNKYKEFGIENWCKDCRKPRSKGYYDKWVRDNAEQRMFISAKNRSKKQSIPFDIDIEDIIVPEYCPVLGIKLDRDGGKCNDSTPSLDKFIPELGYIRGNIFVVSWRANWIKQNSSLEEVEKLYLWMKSPVR
jgi:hypothetical protein